jgi:hypothetical protein
MAVKRITRRPLVTLFGSWDGDNLAELEGAFPDWTLEVNLDGTLHAQSPNSEFNDPGVAVGTWFSIDVEYDNDPATVSYLQEVTVADPVIYTLETE